MSPEIYQIVLAQAIDALQPYYARVETAIEAPEKADYGDVDILVCGAHEQHYNPAHNDDNLEQLSSILGAKQYRHGVNSPSHFFAVPITDVEGDYATVEIQYVDSTERIDWILFQTAHGDMCNILGSMTRCLNLVINDKGLHITIPELEVPDVARIDRLVLLTSEPAKVLKFFGLDESQYWMRFGKVVHMFEYAASSRFFWVKNRSNEEPHAASVGQGARKDEQKASKRNNFARWKEEFIPQCREAGRYSQQLYTAESVRELAFTSFEGVETEYMAKLEDRKFKDQTKKVKALIRQAVPLEGVDGNFRSAAIHAFEDLILNQSPAAHLSHVIVPGGLRRTENGCFDLDSIEAWIKTDWQKVGAPAWEVVKALNAPGWERKKALRAMK